MSRTRRKKAFTINFHKGDKRLLDIYTVRDGSPTHYASSCSRGGSCPWCQGNRKHRDRVSREKYGDSSVEDIPYETDFYDWEDWRIDEKALHYI